MIHYTHHGEMKIYWKSVRRKYPERSTYQVVSKKLRRKCREYNHRRIAHLCSGQNNNIPQRDINEKIEKPQNTVSTLADILKDFISTEKKKLDEYKLTHAPSIGNMYEGLTGEVVNKIIPSNLDLRVVTGFIIDGTGYISGQIDRMLVQGKGEEVPHSGEQYKYHIKDVLVIFEVKKTLRKQDFKDAYEHLRKISSAFSEYFERRLLKGFDPNVKHVAKLFSQITGKPEPASYSDIHSMDKSDSIIFYTLVQDVFSPVTLIHGYGGYKTETGLRNVFFDFIESKVHESGFGAPSLPNLVSSDSFSLVKLSGIPFISPRGADRNWPLVGSSRDNVAQLLVEVIWTKISIFCNVSMPWGDDLGIESFVPLLLGKYGTNPSNNREGWLYSTNKVGEAELASTRRKDDWQPYRVTEAIKNAFQFIGENGGLYLNSKSGIDLIKASKLDKVAFKKILIQTHLCSISRSERITIIGESIHLVEIGGGEFALSDDMNRLLAWCKLNSVKSSPLKIENADKY